MIGTNNLNNKLNEFNRCGFVVIKNLINIKKIKDYEKEIDKISKILVTNYSSPYVNLTKDKKMNTGHHLNELFPKSNLMKIKNNYLLKKFLKKIFNKPLIMKNLEIFAKPPKTGLKAPFHQDNFYWNIKKKMAVNVWIALDKVTIKNGGLIYIKGSHKLGLLKHRRSNIPGSSKEIIPHFLKKIKAKRISPKLFPGDCLIHHCEVVHGSNQNKTSQRRRGIAIRFVARNSQIDKQNMKKYLKDLKN